MPTAPLVDWLTPSIIAYELTLHPSAPVRWIQQGILLTSGERLRLDATRSPGGWRVKREDLNRFLEAITTDRLSPPEPPLPSRRLGGPRRAYLARIDDALNKSGF
jgi:hypothetical protein